MVRTTFDAEERNGERINMEKMDNSKPFIALKMVDKHDSITETKRKNRHDYFTGNYVFL